jgi:signal transduction histidine kinase
MSVRRVSLQDSPSGLAPGVSSPAPRSRRLPEGMELFERPLIPLAVVLTLAFLVVAGISFARSAGLVAALWGASAFAVAIWLRGGKGWAFDLSFGGLIATGIAAGELMAGNSAELTVMFTSMQVLEIVTALVLIRRFAPADPFSTVDGASRFLLAAAVAAPVPAGLSAAAYLTFIHGHAFAETFQTWWFGHALGFATLTPLAMSITRRRLRVLRNPLRLAEGIGLQVGLVVLVTWLFWQDSLPVSFLVSPLLLLIAVRLRLLGSTLGLMIVGLLAVGLTMHGYGPFTIVEGLSRSEHVMLAQLFVVLGCLPTLLVSSVLEERDALATAAELGKRRAEIASGAKSRLLANVAHEIKSPIGGVISIADLWSSGQLGPVTPTQTEMAGMLVKTARQVEALAHDLLDVARAEAGAVAVQLRPTDAGGLLEDMRRAWSVRPEARDLTMELTCDPEPVVALADSQRLAQVLDNLISNAVKYGASGGLIRLVATRIEGRIRLEVIDRGPGLGPEKQAQLFEPFNRLGLERSSIEGHGIGLALAKRLVELQSGRIGVTSAPGAGATFWVELPAA